MAKEPETGLPLGPDDFIAPTPSFEVLRTRSGLFQEAERLSWWRPEHISDEYEKMRSLYRAFSYISANVCATPRIRRAMEFITRAENCLQEAMRINSRRRKSTSKN